MTQNVIIEQFHSTPLIRLVLFLMKSADTELTKQVDLTHAQFKVMGLIKCFDHASQKTVADHLYLTQAAVSRLTEALVEKKYLIRTPNPDNRRENVLHLTALGQKKLQSACDLIHGMEDQLYGHLTKEELSNLKSISQKLLDLVK